MIAFLVPIWLLLAPQEAVISRLFAATEIGPFLSYSWGEHWSRIDGDLRGFSGALHAFVCLGPKVYAGGPDGLFVSEDYGETYLRVASFPGRDVTVLLTARLFDLEPTLFVGTKDGLYRSKDAGHRWARVGEDLVTGEVRAMSWPGPELFVVSGAGLYRSKDGGESWERLGANLPDAPLLSLAVAQFFAIEPTVFVGTRRSGLHKSVDGGIHFAPVGEAELDQNTVSDLFWWRSLLLIGAEDGLFLSSDEGETLEEVKALQDRSILAFSVPAAEVGPSDILVGTDRGVYKSSDGALTFRLVDEGMGLARVFHLATFPMFVQDRERR